MTTPAPDTTDKSRATKSRITVAGNELELFVASAPYIQSMATDIEAARSRVWLETYIFAHDTAGRRIADALIARAKAGVDVRLLYDAFGSQWTSAAIFAEMAEAGVQVHAFHSFWYAVRNWSFLEILNRRNHRKLLVVDDTVAHFGGMNVVDTSTPDMAGQAEADADPAGWRDVHVRLTGPKVADVANSFERSWRRAHHEPVDRRKRAYRRGRLPGGTRDFIRFFDSGPGLNYTRAERVFTRLIGLASRRVLISMAYFLPTLRVLRTILRASRSGRRVTVIVPGISDVPLVQRATRYLYGQLLKRDVAIFERQRAMLHSKAMVIDDSYTVVGSCNLDPRSLDINLEFLAVIRSAAMAAAVTRICEEDQAESHRVTAADVERHSLWQRLLDRMAYSLRWWL